MRAPEERCSCSMFAPDCKQGHAEQQITRTKRRQPPTGPNARVQRAHLANDGACHSVGHQHLSYHLLSASGYLAAAACVLEYAYACMQPQSSSEADKQLL